MESVRPSWRLGRADATFTRGLLIMLAVLYPHAVLVPKVVLWNVDQTASLALVVDIAAIAVPLVLGALILVVAESFAIGRRLPRTSRG